MVDAGFGGLRDDRFTRRLRVADYLDLTDGDTTGFFRDDCDHDRQHLGLFGRGVRLLLRTYRPRGGDRADRGQ